MPSPIKTYDEAVAAGEVHQWQDGDLAKAEWFNANIEAVYDTANLLYTAVDTAMLENKEIVDAQIESLEAIRSGAPAALDTLLEISERLEDDSDTVSALTLSIASKASSDAIETHFSALASNNNATVAYINGVLA